MSPEQSSRSIDYFNRSNPLIKFQTAASIRIRGQMLDLLSLKAGMSVLEVGATPDTELADSNFFSLSAKKKGCEVWITSPEDCSAMAKRFGLKCLPFGDFINRKFSEKFDLVISSAVIEHVGGNEEDKVRHLSQLRAASKGSVAISTPNRHHWLEFHTKLPLIHWLPKSWHRGLLKVFGFGKWAEPDHLDLLSSEEFQEMVLKVFLKDQVSFKNLRFLGMASNLFSLIKVQETKNQNP